MARKKTKRTVRIVISVLIAIAIITSSAVYFYPRLAIYLNISKKVRDYGSPERVVLSGGYGGDYEKISSDWISFNIPLIFGKTEDFEADRSSNWSSFEGNGLTVELKYTKDIEENEPLLSKDYDEYLGASSMNEYKVLLHNTVIERPSIFVPINQLEEEYQKYINHISYHKNKRYDYIEKDGLAFTIWVEEDKKVVRYTITIYDLQDDFNQIGAMSIYAPISANKEIKLTDGAILFMLESVDIYEPPKTR